MEGSELTCLQAPAVVQQAATAMNPASVQQRAITAQYPGAPAVPQDAVHPHFMQR